eukprot:1193948-Prorocentrum_minimum.AAC.6
MGAKQAPYAPLYRACIKGRQTEWVNRARQSVGESQRHKPRTTLTTVPDALRRGCYCVAYAKAASVRAPPSEHNCPNAQQ